MRSFETIPESVDFHLLKKKTMNNESKGKLYPMNNTVNQEVADITSDPRKQRAKKKKIVRSTIKQLRSESKNIIKGINK